MKNITLKEYFEIKGYGKGKKINVSKFADIVNASVSYISKLINCQPIANGNSKKFEQIKKYVARDGYNLVLGNTIDLGYNNILRNNDKLKLENKQLKIQNELLNKQLSYYESLFKICNFIVDNKDKLDEITFSIRNKHNKKGE